MNNLYTICGLRNSGKTEVAHMLQFLLNSPKIFHHYFIYKRFSSFFVEGKYKIYNFATPLKEILSILLNVELDRFEDRDFKENYFIDFNTLNMYHRSQVPEEKMLSDGKFARMAKGLNPALTLDYYLSVRQALQFIGTEVLRTFLTDKLFILCTLKSIGKYGIIGDARFVIEIEECMRRNASIIFIDRPGCVVSEHASEKQVMSIKERKQYNHLVKNDGTLKDLFNNLKRIVWE